MSAEEIEERRAARKAAAEEERKTQRAKDLEAIDAMEVATGDDVATLSVPVYRKGLPALIGVKAPGDLHYKRFAQMIRRAGDNVEARANAQELLAESCWCYPTAEDKETRTAMVKAFPGLLVSVAIKAAELAELKADDEKKG